MLFEDYYSSYLELKEKRSKRKSIDSQIEELRGMIDIKAVAPKDVVGGTNARQDKMLVYMVNKERLEARKIKLDNEIEILKQGLKIKENELKNSKELLDRIYYYRYIEHRKVNQFNKFIGYSIRQTYRYLEDINNTLFD